MHRSAYFDPGADRVRFWVPMGEVLVDACVGRATLHYRYHPRSTSDEPLATYEQHATEIHGAVRRRMVAGAREPVLLRDADLQPGGVLE